MEFNREECRRLTAQAVAELQEFAAERGLSIARKGGSFTSTSYVMKLEFSVINEDGTAMTESRQLFLSGARQYGLEPEDLDRIFRYHGTQYRITGLKPRARKYPIVAEMVSSGKPYKFPAHLVRDALHHNPVN